MSKRDRDPTQTETGTQPGKGAVREAALEGFRADLPKYVFDRPQSDDAEAARYQAPPMTPPKPTAGMVDEGKIEVALSDPGERTRDTVDLKLERALRAPSNTDLGPERRDLERMRDPALGGISTDPGREERRRNTAILSLALVAIVIAFVTLGIGYRKLQATAPSTTTAVTSASTPSAAPLPTLPTPPLDSAPTPPPSTAPPVITHRSSLPKATSTSPPPVSMTPPAPSPSATTTGSVDPLTHVLDKH